MKALILSSLLFFTNTSIAQDIDSAKRSKIGIYQTFEELQAGKPSVTKSFRLDTTWYILNVDTVIEGYSYRFMDSSKRLSQPFAMFDGKDIYLYFKNKVKFNLISGIRVMDYPPKMFQKSYGKGKIPFIIIGRTTYISDLGLADAIISDKNEIWYVNKNGKFLQATPQAIGVLLRNEKDLLKEFEKERKYNNEVYVKYLQKMNERYPL